MWVRVVTLLLLLVVLSPLTGALPSVELEDAQPSATDRSQVYMMRNQSPSVSFTPRSIVVDGVPRFLASGGFHYPRASTGSWRPIMRQMKANGLNTITTYAFWELHERRRGTYDWGQIRPEANVTHWLQIAQEEGLWVHMRVGPYINGNWNNGGFPAWLRDVPGIHFRTANAPFEREMGRWFTAFVDHIRPWLKGNGAGTVLSLQVENEYSYSTADDMRYIDWAAELCNNASRGEALCTMCNNTGSPTLPNYRNTIFTCNADCNTRLKGGAADETWIDGHKRAYPNQPSLYSEIEVADPGWSDLPKPPGGSSASDLSYEATRFVADGGMGTNYWMWFGGTNFRAASNMPTTFMWSAPLGSFGLPNQPMFDHIGKMHRLFVQFEATLAGQPVPNREWLAFDHVCYRRSYKPVAGYPGLTFLVDTGARSVAMISQSGVVLFNSSDVLTELASNSNNDDAGYKDAETSVSAPLLAWTWWQEPLIGLETEAGPSAPILSDSAPLEQLHLTADRSDYLSYSAHFTVNVSDGGHVGAPGTPRLAVCTLSMLVSDATIVYSWLDQKFLKSAGVLDNSLHNSGFRRFALQLQDTLEVGSTHRIDLTSCNLGLNDDWPGPAHAMYGEYAKKGILSNVSVSCRNSRRGLALTSKNVASQRAAATATATAAPQTMALTVEICGKLTVNPITEKQAFVFDKSGGPGLVHYQTKASGQCLGTAISSTQFTDTTLDGNMPDLVLMNCNTTDPGQLWTLNTTKRLLLNELHGCDGGPECALSEYGNGGYKAGDRVVLYGAYQGSFGPNQYVTATPSPTGSAAHQLLVATAGLCVTAGGKPPPPPPLPPGQVVLGPWLHRNGTIGEYHRLFMPEVAARWTAWQRCRVPAAGGGALLGAESSSHRHNTSNGPTGKPMVWLSARFDAPAPVSSNRSSSGPPLPLALKMGSTSVPRGATKGRAWVNGYEIGSYWSKSFAAGAQGPQVYLIPEDYLTPSKKGNLLVLLEDFGLVDDGCARGKVEGIEVVRAEQAWG